MTTADWLALAVGAVLVLLAIGAVVYVIDWQVRKAIAARTCPVCGCRASIPTERSFSDGAARLIDQLDRQKET